MFICMTNTKPAVKIQWRVCCDSELCCQKHLFKFSLMKLQIWICTLKELGLTESSLYWYTNIVYQLGTYKIHFGSTLLRKICSEGPQNTLPNISENKIKFFGSENQHKKCEQVAKKKLEIKPTQNRISSLEHVNKSHISTKCAVVENEWFLSLLLRAQIYTLNVYSWANKWYMTIWDCYFTLNLHH